MSELEDRKWSEQDEPVEMLETDHAIGIIDGKNALISPSVLRGRLNKGPQVFDDHVKGESFEGSGALLTDLTSPGPGGSSSEADLELVCNSAGANPTTKILGRKNVTGIFEIDENGFLLKTGPYSHADDAIPFNKDINQNGKELINSKTILDQQINPYYHFDGESGSILVPNNAKFAELFKNGGSYICGFNAFSAGKSNLGTFFSKANILLHFDSTTQKLGLFVVFTTTNGVWLTDALIDYNKNSVIVVRYNGSSTSNHPTIYIDGVSVPLTQDRAPVGTLVSDVGNDCYFGDTITGTLTFHGNKYFEKFLNYEISDAEAKSISSNPQKALDFADEGGSNVAQNVGTCVTSTDPYDTFSGASATGFTAIKTTTTTTQRGGTLDEIVVKKGKKYLVSFDIIVNSGANPTYNLARIYNGTIISEEGNKSGPTGSHQQIFTAIEDTTAVLVFWTLGANVTDYTISNLNVHQLGVTLSLDGKNFTANTAYDSSGNGNHGTVTGATLANKSRQLTEERGTFTATLTCGTSGTITLDSAQNTLSYRKLGSEVSIYGKIVVAAIDAPSGSLTLNTLPHTCTNLAEESGDALISVKLSSLGTIPVGAVSGIIPESSNGLIIQDGYNLTGVPTWFANHIAVGTTITVSGSYLTDD